MADTTTPLLEIRDLVVNFAVYGGELHVLDGVNFRMYPGERVGLVGETGCGKTTTMKAVLRVLPMPPARIPHGEILFKGNDILRMKDTDLRLVRGQGISMIFQDPTAALNPVFTVGEQMQAVIQSNAQDNNLKVSRQKSWELAVSALKDVSLADPERLLKSYP
ncbi:MAG: ATP-binding cassette domain-containing protein, partial [Anaerolineales bacterium]|nr:ATP-binding cassette domain-containing protein [Anaerolineales bacterium]